MSTNVSRYLLRLTTPVQFDENDRAILEGQTDGFVKIHVKQGTDRILGATIVGEGAGDMIRYIVVLVVSNTELALVTSDQIHMVMP